MESKAKRQPNFTADEVEVIIQCVEHNSKLLFGKFFGIVSATSKDQCWEEIARAVSAASGIPRSTSEIKKKWTCLKSDAKTMHSRSRKQSQQTGGGPCEKAQDEVTLRDRIVGVIFNVCVEGVIGGLDTASASSTSVSISSPAALAMFPLVASTSHFAATTAQPVASTSSATVLHVPESDDRGDDGNRDATSAAPSSLPVANPLAASVASKGPSATKRSAVEAQLIDLQQQTLVSFNKLVDINQQLLELKKAKLEIQREKLGMKRAEMLSKGVFHDGDGNWVALVGNSTEE